MKASIYLFLGIYSLLFSCSPKEKTPLALMEDSIKAYLMKNLDDPSSYESVQSEIMDTTLYSENLEHLEKLMQEFAGRMDPEYGKDAKARYLIQAGFYKNQLDSLLSSSNPNAVAAYRVLHTFRAKNKFGALVKDQLKFEFRPDLSIHAVRSMTDSKGSPGGVPHYAP